jgi:hypothetical protein
VCLGTQGCPRCISGMPWIFWTCLLLRNVSRTTPVVTDFLCILPQTDWAFLKIAALTTMIYPLQQKKTCISLAERKKVCRQLYYTNTRIGCRQRENWNSHWSRTLSKHPQCRLTHYTLLLTTWCFQPVCSCVSLWRVIVPTNSSPLAHVIVNIPPRHGQAASRP